MQVFIASTLFNLTGADSVGKNPKCIPQCTDYLKKAFEDGNTGDHDYSDWCYPDSLNLCGSGYCLADCDENLHKRFPQVSCTELCKYQAPNPTASRNLLQNSQAKSADKSIASAADAVDRKNPYRDGWECKHNMYCLKADGLELIKYDEPSGQSWDIVTCQKKCEEYGEGCVMVDIHSYTGDFNHNQSTCTLYTIFNALIWDDDVPDPEKNGCHHLSTWMACAHNGKSPWGQAPKPTMSKNSLKDSQAKSADKSVAAAADAVDRKNPSYRAGWECKHNMYCLKEDGLELIKYDEPSGQSWNVATCQKKCEEYGEGCVMVDIHSYTDDFDYNQSTCVLYTIENALIWDDDVPDPEKNGCHHLSSWMTCAHTGKSLLI